MDLTTSGRDPTFEHLYRTWCPVVRRAAMELLDDADAAEDVAHDIFLRLLRNDTWRGIEAPATYFRSAGFREALCIQRDRRVLEPIGQTEVEKLPLRGPGPEELAWREECRRILKAHVAQLPTRCARVITHVGFGEQSHAEAAAGLGVSVSAVEKQMARGREHLQRRLRLDENGDLRRVSTFEDGGGIGRFVHLYD